MNNNNNYPYGFFVTRYMNDENSQIYWKLCVKQIRRWYGKNIWIIIIDDHSPLLERDEDTKIYEYDKKLRVIKSKYDQGCGELLPYIYFANDQEYKWEFRYAIMIHDSIFFHRYIKFEQLIQNKIQWMPLWNFQLDKTINIDLIKRIFSMLNYSSKLFNILINLDTNLKLDMMINSLSVKKQNKCMGCFGAIAWISKSCILNMQNKYNICNLVKCIRTKEDRCCLERVIGILFGTEYPLTASRSMFGDIHKFGKQPFSYTYSIYIQDLKKFRVFSPIVKIWSGR